MRNELREFKPIWSWNKHVNITGVLSDLWCGKANQNQPVKDGWRVKKSRKYLS